MIAKLFDSVAPDVNIISIQGPKSKILVDKMFGKEASELKFFRHKKITFKDLRSNSDQETLTFEDLVEKSLAPVKQALKDADLSQNETGGYQHPQRYWSVSTNHCHLR